FMHVQEMRPAKLKRFLRQPHFEQHLALHRLDCTSSNGMLGNLEFCRQKLEELSQEELQPPRLLTGGDLMEAGYAAGPLLGRILSAVEDAQLNGEIATKEDALAWVRQRYPLT